IFFFSSRRRHTRFSRDWSSDVCSSDLKRIGSNMKKTTTFLMLWVLFASNGRASEQDLYDFLWLDPDKEVYVLQNKLYPKYQTFYFDIGYLIGLSNEFQDTNGIQLKGGYYFHEEWAVELQYMQYSNSDNSAYKNIQII